jgi:hypothetical protein
MSEPDRALALSDATLAYGEDLTCALLGLDTLYRAESGDGDGLAVLNMAFGFQPEPFADYAAARERFTELATRAAILPEPDRRLYYEQTCRSSLAVIRWRTAGVTLPEQIADFLHLPAAPASDGELDDLRGAMRGLLNELGYSGDLVAQCAAWEERQRVPPEAVPDVLRELLDEAWDRTVERLELPAPKSDGMRVEPVSGVAYNARCDFLHRTIQLNIDPILTRPALKHLAVHEGYPGHYAQFKLREALHARGEATSDGLLSVVNTAHSSVFEGIADNGLRLIDWYEGADDRFSALMTRYRAGIGTGAAWRLHALGWPEERVADWLRVQTLVGGEGWVANRLRFIAAPQRCALIWSYWAGEAAVAPVWEGTPTARHPGLLRYLYGRLHSPQSLNLFA